MQTRMRRSLSFVASGPSTVHEGEPEASLHEYLQDLVDVDRCFSTGNDSQIFRPVKSKDCWFNPFFFFFFFFKKKKVKLQ